MTWSNDVPLGPLDPRLTERDFLPPERKLVRWIREGWTFRQIEDECAAYAGLVRHELSRVDRLMLTYQVDSAVSRAMDRVGLGRRYQDCVPWRVLDVHRDANPARMLRLLGRRRCGQPLGPEKAGQLGDYLMLLRRARLVIGYCPADEDGFVYVPDAWRTGPNEDIPIVVPMLMPDEIEWVRMHEG